MSKVVDFVFAFTQDFGFVVLIALLVLAGCIREPRPTAIPKYKQGEVVLLVLNNKRAQVTGSYCHDEDKPCSYWIRVEGNVTEKALENASVEEFELKPLPQ